MRAHFSALLAILAITQLAAAADVRVGPERPFHDIAVRLHRVVAIVGHDDHVSVFIHDGFALYAKRPESSTGRVVLSDVQDVSVSTSAELRRVMWQSNGVISMAALMEDDSVDASTIRLIAMTGKSPFIACNDARCITAYTDATGPHAAIVDADGEIVAAVTLPLPQWEISFLATDPSGFLFSAPYRRLFRISNDGAILSITGPTELGEIHAADFDGTQYVLVGEVPSLTNVAAFSLSGEIGPVHLIVDERSKYAYQLPYQSRGVQLAWNGATHLLITHETTDSFVSISFLWPTEAVAHPLSADLAPLGPQRRLSGHEATGPAGIVYAAGKYWVAWYTYPQMWLLWVPVDTIQVAVVAPDAAALNDYSTPAWAAAGPIVAVAASDEHTVGVWSENEPTTGRYRVLAKLDRGGAPIQVAHPSSLSGGAANIANVFLVAARDDAAVSGVILTPEGSTPVADLASIGDGTGMISVAANGDRFLVVTSESERLVSLAMTPDGFAAGAKMDLGPCDLSTPVAAASDGTAFAVLYRRSQAVILKVIDSSGNVIATRELSRDAPSSLVMTWSGRDYVAVGADGSQVTTWRLSAMGEVIAVLTESSNLLPLSIARSGDNVLATWTGHATLTFMPPWSSGWSAAADTRFLALIAGRTTGGAVLLSSAIHFGMQPVPLVTREVATPAPPRRRAAR